MYTVLFFLFHHCQHQQTPNQLIADKTLQYNQNNTDGRLGCPSTWHVYLPCPCYWSLASPHTPSVPLLSIKHFRLSMVGPYTAITSLLGVFLVATLINSVPLLQKRGPILKETIENVHVPPSGAATTKFPFCGARGSERHGPAGPFLVGGGSDTIVG